MKRLSYSILILLTFVVLPVSADHVKWLVKPQYDAISHYSHNLYKCVNDGKVQLINLSGQALLPSAVDSITDFSEGYALILDREGDRMKIKGFLTEPYHTLVPINDDCYATFYSHFSEGCLVVADITGKKGFLDTKGKRIIDCQYQSARPVIQGWASVVDTKGKTKYIDRNGSTLSIHGFHFGNLSQGTSFNEKGEALVCHTKNDGQSDFAIINTKGQVVRQYYKTNRSPVREYDFAFDEEGVGYKPKRNTMPTFDMSIISFSSKGLLGYQKETEVVVPAQFSNAGLFADGCAIVALKGKYGIIALTEGDFSVILDPKEITLRAGKPKELQLSLNYPDDIQANDLQVRFDNGDGELRAISLGQNGYSFVPYLEKKAKCSTIRIEVSKDGLLLWEESMTINVSYKGNPLINISVPAKTNEYANANDLLTVKTTIANNTTERAKISATFSVPTTFGNNKNSIVSDTKIEETLAPGEKKDFSISFHVEDLETVKLTLTVRANQEFAGTKSADITLKPYDH